MVVLGVFFAAAALEAGLRVASALAIRRERIKARVTNPAGEYWAVADPDLGYVSRPNFGDLNSDGLRDHPIGPKAGRFRLLILGDSIAAFGDDLDDTFVARMRDELRKDPANSNLDVVNASIKGYTNFQEVGYLKKYGLKFQPDLVGIEFCLNDVHKFLADFRFDENGQIISGTYSRSGDEMRKSRSWLRGLLSRSYLLVWIRDNVGLVARIAAWQARHGFLFDYQTNVNTAWKDSGWVDIEKQLTEFRDLGRSNNFKVFLTVFPLAAQYRPDYLARDREYVLKPQRKLREICARLGIPFYDLYPDLDSSLLLPEDGMHLTRPGRLRAGQLFARFLEQQHLLLEAAKGQGQQAAN